MSQTVTRSEIHYRTWLGLQNEPGWVMDKWSEGGRGVTVLKPWDESSESFITHLLYVWFIERLSSHIRATLHKCYCYSFSKLEGLIPLNILTPFSDHYVLLVLWPEDGSIDSLHWCVRVHLCVSPYEVVHYWSPVKPQCGCVHCPQTLN